MGYELAWMPAQAPYMPISVVGLLSILESAGSPADCHWRSDDVRSILHVETHLSIDETAERVASAAWPNLESIAWPAGRKQGLKPTLKECARPLLDFQELARTSGQTERAMLRAMVTDAVVDADGVPARSRLMRGIKADLASMDKRPKAVNVGSLADELRAGPRMVGTTSGLGLGLVPEVQTFGGTTGPDAEKVGAYSTLLYLLLWQGLLALPPTPVAHRYRRIVGGPLVTGPDLISWPRWSVSVDSQGLRSLFAWAELHAEKPNRSILAERGIDAVYRSRTVALNKAVDVFRWGEQVAEA